MTDDPGPDSITVFIQIAFILLMIIFNALVCAGQTAMTALNDAWLEKQSDDGNKKAKRIMRMVSESNRFLNTSRLCRNFLCTVVTATAILFYCDRLAGVLSFANAQTARILSAIMIVIGTTFVYMTLGIMLPKKVGSAHDEKISFALTGFMALVTAVFRPFSALNNGVAGILSRIFATDPNADIEKVTEEEIRMLVDAGEENGVIEESQKAMINNIFEFDDIAASDVMTHRTDMVAVDLSAGFDDVIDLAISEGYSRIPAYDGDIDDIKGIIYVKDLLRYVGHELPKGGLAQIMRSAHFVPETKRCGDLFTEMTEKRIQMCIVSDEYGGTAGLVTIEDLLESIVGNIQDEYDDEEEDVEQINDTTFTVDGTTDIDDINEELSIELPDGDYDTVGGMIMSIIGHIPDAGEDISVEVEGCRFTVEEVTERRIEKVRIEKLPEQEEQ